MNCPIINPSSIALFGASILAFTAPSAEALTLKPQPIEPSQVAFTAAVRHGLAVSASSPMNRLIAGGSYVVRCAHANTGTIEGQRSFGSSAFGWNQLTVTVPETLPAIRDLPGFDVVAAGTTLSCNFSWTAFAEESTYSIGSGGIGITVGGMRAGDGSSISFEMRKRGEDGERDNTSCIH
jgi:hypothetical protein